MSNETAITPFQPQSIEQAAQLAERLARSALLPEALRGKPADVLVTLLTGHELGLSPMQAIRGLHVIKGKAVMSADLTVALVKRHGDCVFFKLVETTDTVASYETERKGEGKTKMSFTIEQAKQAGLLGNDNWRKYPAAMLRARCASALARAVYPDLTLGIYTPDEAEEFSGAPPQPSERDVTPLRRPTPVASEKPVANTNSEEADFSSESEPSERQLSPLEQVEISIAEAQTREQLDKLVATITKLPRQEQLQVRQAFGRRMKEVSHAAPKR